MTPIPPETVLRTQDQLPLVTLLPGLEVALAHVDIKAGLWVVRNRLAPGVQIQTHRHTGPVFAFTVTGAWHYLESPEQVCRPGSYLFEPAGSVHTLKALDDNDGPTDVWFAIWGANLNLAADGSVESVVDAGVILTVYRYACEAAGHPDPPVYVQG